MKAKEEAKAAREEAKAAAAALKLAEREAKKEAKKADREAAKKVSKKGAAVDKAEPNVADEVELVVEAYESESDMVCDGAKSEGEMLRQPSTGYEALDTEKTERDVFEEPSRFYDSYCDP